MSHRFFAVLLFSSFVGVPLLANPPEASYIFPAGGQRGTTVPVKVGGLFLYEKCGFEMLGDGIQAPNHLKRTKTIWFEGPFLPMPSSQRREDYPKDMAGQIRIDANAQLGIRHWRLWTSEGATPARRFVIGHLREIVEKEIDGDPIPDMVKLPVTINGRVFPRADVDVWTIDAKKGQIVTCVVHAARIGTPLDARLEIRGPEGRHIAENDDAYGADPFVRFTAPVAGVYEIRIHDIRFAGGQDYVYRLTVTSDPYIDRVYPLGGKRGSKMALQLAGQGLPKSRVEVNLPISIKPVCRHHLTIAGKRLNDFLLDLDNLPEYREMESFESEAKFRSRHQLGKIGILPHFPAGKIGILPHLPAIFNGRIDRPGDVDEWQWQAKKGETYVFDLRAGRLGSPLDGVLTIVDAGGKQLARAEASGKQVDPQLRFTVRKDGVYAVKVQDRFRSRGGPAFAYRLRAANPADADFRLWLQNDAITLPRKGEAKLKVLVEKNGGFKGAIKLKIVGLPKGVEAKTVEIPKNRNNVDLQLSANKTAKIETTHLTIIGTANINGSDVARRATLKAQTGEPVVESLLLAVALPTPFQIKSEYTMGFVPRGTVQLRKYKIERKGYDGPIEVSLSDKQARHLQGVTGPKITVPAGATEFAYPVKLPPWMEMGRTCRVCVVGVATVSEKDGSTHRVGHSSTATAEQFIAVIGPGQLALEVPRTSFRVKPKQALQVPVRVRRSPKLKGKVTVELLVPSHMKDIHAQLATIPAGQEVGMVVIDIKRDLTAALNMPLTLRATMMQQGRPVIAERKIELVPALQ